MAEEASEEVEEHDHVEGEEDVEEGEE